MIDINLKKFKWLVIFFSLFVLVLGLSSFIALCPFVYFSEASRTGADLLVVDSSVLYKNVRDFLLFKSDLSNKFTVSEASHMRDVRLVFVVIWFLSFVFLSFLFFCFFYLKKLIILKKKNSKKNLFLFFDYLKKGSLFSFIFLIALLFFAWFSFDFAFDLFHRIFFPQGNWVFPFDSLLIILFPSSFFVGISTKLFVLSLFFSISLFVLFHFLGKKYVYVKRLKKK